MVLAYYAGLHIHFFSVSTYALVSPPEENSSQHKKIIRDLTNINAIYE